MREPLASDREYIEAQREHHTHVTQANANVPQQASGDSGRAQEQQPSKEEGKGYPPIGTGRHQDAYQVTWILLWHSSCFAPSVTDVR